MGSADEEYLTDFDRTVNQAEACVISALAGPGDVQQAATAALAEAELLAPWVTVDEAGRKALNVNASNAEFQLGRTVLEQAVRQACASLVAEAEAAKSGALAYGRGTGGSLVARLLDVTLHLGAQRQIEPAVIFTVMEDVMELCTIEEAVGVFAYLESRLDRLRAMFNFAATAHSKLAVLRICNQLLRRLSRASSSELCGRILMFLTQLLPLLDRSGLNVQGQFNTSHSTPVEDVPEGTVDSDGQAIDAPLYAAFWGLQAAFQAPYAAMEPSRWAATIADVKRVLAAFAQQPVALASSGAGGGAAEEALLTVKYLSSPVLLRLQLSDAAARRHFCLQALVFLHACRTPPAKASGAQQAAARKEALRSKQVLEADELEGLLYAELRRTPQHGEEFAAACRTVLARETKWAAWKADGCKGFEREESAPLSVLPLSPQLKTAAPPVQNRVQTGSDELDRLWNISQDNMTCLKGDRARPRAPDLAQLLAPVILEMDPEEEVEEQYKTKHDDVLSWKALRLISRTSLPVFSKMLNPAAGGKVQRKGIGGVPADRAASAPAAADKKEPAAPKLDLEDAVHELLPDLVPKGAHRRPALPTPPSAAGSEGGTMANARVAEADTMASPPDQQRSAAAAAVAGMDVAAPGLGGAAELDDSGKGRVITDGQPAAGEPGGKDKGRVSLEAQEEELDAGNASGQPPGLPAGGSEAGGAAAAGEEATAGDVAPAGGEAVASAADAMPGAGSKPADAAMIAAGQTLDTDPAPEPGSANVDDSAGVAQQAAALREGGAVDDNTAADPAPPREEAAEQRDGRGAPKRAAAAEPKRPTRAAKKTKLSN